MQQLKRLLLFQSLATTSTILSTYQGSLSNSSAVYGGVTQSTTNYTYEAIQVYTNRTGTYTFTGTSGNNLQLYGYLYNGTFIPTNPQTNLITKSDNASGSSFQFNLTSAITSFTEYILVVTSANQTSTGSFNINASGPGTILFTRRNVYSQFGKLEMLSHISNKQFPLCSKLRKHV